MDLFVVNRHVEGQIVGQISEVHDEETKLAEVVRRIEERKRKKQVEIEASEVPVKTKKRESKSEPLIEETIDDIKEPQQPQINKNEGSKKQIKSLRSDLEGFKVLGNDNFNKRTEVKRVLPYWLKHPTIISVNLQKLEYKTSDLKQLDKSLRKKLKANGIKRFFPVQAEVIPYLLDAYEHSDILFPRDICVSAPTGSGKTLAFVLPVVQALKRYTVKRIRALVILPTQDLAMQVFKSFKRYTEGTSLDVCIITGKTSFANEQKQLVIENVAFGYQSKVDILVCTAGKLVDHLKLTKGFDLKSLEFLVIDEADRVLDNVQNDWLYHLEQHMQDETVKCLNLYALKRKRPPQKLLFSATLSQDPEKLQKLSLFQPKLFTSVVESRRDKKRSLDNSEGTFVGKYTTPNELTEKYIVSSMTLKPLLLYKYLVAEKLKKTLIFTHSVESAHRLALLLQMLFADQLVVQEISSGLVIKNRNTLLDKFSNGEVDLIICTDSMARGMDFAGVQCVISYSAPIHLKTYIHRVGRTARAGQKGLAVTILTETQIAKFKKMLQQANKTNLSQIEIPEDDLENLEDQYRDALESLGQAIAKEEGDNLTKIKTQKRPLVTKDKKKKKRKVSTSETKANDL